ncbi:MAG: MotA/TolQ/ExbB proton channel family protein [Armatimonadetes bacterium]|nr:MotA/TolQ/ExbB proton channel family protein [Armatimonadota bacterium]
MEEFGPRHTLLIYFQQGGIAMYPLLLCSIASVAIAVERIWALYRAGRGTAELKPSLAALISKGHVGEVVERCAGADSPLARLMLAALTAPPGGPEQRHKALERALTQEASNLERYLSVLATIGSVSPFVGLFGTVLGIMRAFRDIGLAGAAGGAVVAAGIAEALIATAAGLFVAVIGVVAYNHLMGWAQSIVTQAQLSAEELIAQLEGSTKEPEAVPTVSASAEVS